jgi:hypothetical protein
MVDVRGGAYVVEALPAGEYFVVALPAGGAGDWQSPEQFARWAATGLRVTLQPYESRTLDLTVGGAR